MTKSASAAKLSLAPSASNVIEAPMAQAPNAEEIDAFAVEYKRLEKILDEAKAELAKVKGKEGSSLDKLHSTLIDIVRAFGGKHAEKSKILHGIEWELMATFGQSSSIDTTAVESLRLKLKAAGKTRLLKKLFTEERSYRLAPNASEVLKAEGKLPDRLAMAALACFTFTPRTPQLEVRPAKK
jgi:hypothetical protein